MAELRYDVVVVGAGPAGSTAARAAAARGVSVLMIDRRAEVGRPVQCAEYVPRLISRDMPLTGACVAQKTTAMRTYLPSGESVLMAAPGFILNRAHFDKYLAVAAVRAGVDMMARSTAVERTQRGLVLRTGGREQEIAARVIVGADGAHSTVGRWIGQRNTCFVVAAQYELIVDSPATETEVYFAPEYVQGYAWLFPKGHTANVGVGIVRENSSSDGASAVLDHFVERLRETGRIKRANAVACTGGFIPVGGLMKGWSENVVLAGDAAGCVHPLTGAGIHFATVSGRLAGECAAAAVNAGDLNLLAEYEGRCREAIGGPIARGLVSRGRLAAGWSDNGAVLERLVRQNWIAFEGYATGQAGDPRSTLTIL